MSPGIVPTPDRLEGQRSSSFASETAVDSDDVIELGDRLRVAVEAVADQLAGAGELNLDALLGDLHEAGGRLTPLVAAVKALPRSLAAREA